MASSFIERREDNLVRKHQNIQLNKQKDNKPYSWELNLTPMNLKPQRLYSKLPFVVSGDLGFGNKIKFVIDLSSLFIAPEMLTYYTNTLSIVVVLSARTSVRMAMGK